MGNIICDNYYCQPVSFKPEWFSESAWNIDYKYKDTFDKKPYTIEKGILKIHTITSFDLILSKKLFIDFNNIKNILVPINFRYNTSNNNEFSIYIIFSNKLLSLDNINDLNSYFFNVNVNLFEKYCLIQRSFNDLIIKKKINSKKTNTFSIQLENNLNILLFTEKLYNDSKITLYENKFLKNYNNDIENNLFLNIFIKVKDDLKDNEFIELNFE